MGESSGRSRRKKRRGRRITRKIREGEVVIWDELEPCLG